MSTCSIRLATFAVMLAGCASGIQVVTRPERAARPISAIAVYPFQFRWDEPAYRSFQLGWAEALDLLPCQRFAVYGPGEFEVRQELDDNAFAASDLATFVAGRGQRVEELLVLRGWVERREQQSATQIYNDQGKPAGERLNADVAFIAHVELLDPLTRAVLVEAVGTVHPDPFAERREDDPAPDLTRLVHALTRRVAKAIPEIAQVEGVSRALPFDFIWNPAGLFRFEEQGRPALEAELAKLDPVSREMARWSAVRFFAPQATEAQVSALLHMPGGLWVTRANADGLQQDDLIVEVGSEPATPLSLARALRKARVDEAVPLSVRRGGGARVAVAVRAAE